MGLEVGLEVRVRGASQPIKKSKTDQPITSLYFGKVRLTVILYVSLSIFLSVSGVLKDITTQFNLFLQKEYYLEFCKTAQCSC